MGFLFDLNSQSFFGFCLIWVLGGSNIGRKGGGRFNTILAARQTYFGEFFGHPSGKNTFSKNAPPKNSSFIG